MSSLTNNTTLETFNNHYWTRVQLDKFARSVGLSTNGGCRDLHDRVRRYIIDRRPEVANLKPASVPDSSVDIINYYTPVISLKLDAPTRRFFVSQIGPQFKFNQYLRNIASLENPRTLNLTYGDLVSGWYEFEQLRKVEKPIKPQYQYQQFIRDYLRNNESKTITDAAAAWNLKKSCSEIRNRLA